MNEYIYIYITRLASNKIFSPSNKINQEVAPLQTKKKLYINSQKLITYLLADIYSNIYDQTVSKQNLDRSFF